MTTKIFAFARHASARPKRVRVKMSKNGDLIGSPIGGIWCVVANVTEVQIFGETQETQIGTKHFSPGTKVYCFPPLWGDGYENIKVIGRHRGSRKLITMIIPSKRLENWRVKYVYHPHVIYEILKEGVLWNKETAENMVRCLQVEK